jgi:hypothetical protein
MKKITLEQFYNLLDNAYAVTVNDYLYFIGYDEDENPYISNNADDENYNYIDLSTVDGDIKVLTNEIHFEIAGESIRMLLLGIQTPKV